MSIARPQTAPSRGRRSGNQAAPVADAISLGSRWPSHLVPLCVDERTSRPFPYVLDVAHLSNFSELTYFEKPTLVTIESPSVSSARDPLSVLRNTPGGTAQPAAGRAGQQPQMHLNYMFRPYHVVGKIDLQGASLVNADDMEIEHSDSDSDGGEKTSRGGGLLADETSTEGTSDADSSDSEADGKGATGTSTQLSAMLASKRTGLDTVAAEDGDVGSSRRRKASDKQDDKSGASPSMQKRLFRLRVPNHDYYLRPATFEQLQALERHIPAWIASCALDVYNSPLALIHVELTLSQSPDTSPRAADRGSKTSSSSASFATDRRASASATAPQQPADDTRRTSRKELLSLTGYRFVFTDTSTITKEQYEAARGVVTTGEAGGAPKVGSTTAFGGLRATTHTPEAGPAVSLAACEPCTVVHDVSSEPLEARRHVVLVVPYSIVSSVVLVPYIEHTRHGRLSLPASQRNISLSRIFGLHASPDAALTAPLVSVGGSAGFLGDARVWWEPIAYESVSLSLQASNLFRKNFYYVDPLCRLSLKVPEGDTPSGLAARKDVRGGVSRRSGSPTKALKDSGHHKQSRSGHTSSSRRVTQADADPVAGRFYNVFEPFHLERLAVTEAYRDRCDVSFRPLLLGCPMQLQVDEPAAREGEEEPHLPSLCNAAAAIRRHCEGLTAACLREAGALPPQARRPGPSPLAPFTSSWGGVRVTSAKGGAADAPSSAIDLLGGGAVPVIASGDTAMLTFTAGFASHILPPVTLAERQRAAITFTARYGAIAVSTCQAGQASSRQLPVVDWGHDVLHIDVIDAGFDPDEATTSPAVVGSFEVSAKTLLGAPSHPSRNFPILRNTNYDDTRKGRSALRQIVPSGDSFVALTPSTQGKGISQLMSRAHQRRALHAGMLAHIAHAVPRRRVTFQDYFGGASPSWELAGGLYIDLGSEAYPAHRQQCFANGWNAMHGVIVAAAYHLAPMLKRGALDLYSCAVEMPQNQFVVSPVLTAADAFGGTVDEVAMHREMTSGSAPLHDSTRRSGRGVAASTAGAKRAANGGDAEADDDEDSAPLFEPASSRDWNGERLVPHYEQRRVGVSKSLSATLPFFLCATVRRAALRSAALQEARNRLLAQHDQQTSGSRHNGSPKRHDDVDTETDSDGSAAAQDEQQRRDIAALPRSVYYTATIVIGPGGAPDFDEALRLFAELSTRNIFYVLVYIDSYADSPSNDEDRAAAEAFRAEVTRQRAILTTYANVRTAVVPGGTGRFADLHEGFESLHRAYGDMSDAFLSFARITACAPTPRAPAVASSSTQHVAAASEASGLQKTAAEENKSDDAPASARQTPAKPPRPATAPARRQTAATAGERPTQSGKSQPPPPPQNASRRLPPELVRFQSAKAAFLEAFGLEDPNPGLTAARKKEEDPPAVASQPIDETSAPAPKPKAKASSNSPRKKVTGALAASAVGLPFVDLRAAPPEVHSSTANETQPTRSNQISQALTPTPPQKPADAGTRVAKESPRAADEAAPVAARPKPRATARVAPTSQVVTATGEEVLVADRGEYEPLAKSPSSTRGRTAAESKLSGVGDVAFTVVDLFQSEEEAIRRQQASRRTALQSRGGMAHVGEGHSERASETVGQKLTRLHHERFARAADSSGALREDDAVVPGKDLLVDTGAGDGSGDDADDHHAASAAAAPADGDGSGTPPPTATPALADERQAHERTHGRNASAEAACGVVPTKVTRSGQVALNDQQRRERRAMQRRPHTAGSARGRHAEKERRLVDALVKGTPQTDEQAASRALREAALRDDTGTGGTLAPRLVVPMPPPSTLPREDDAMANYVRDTYHAPVIREFVSSTSARARRLDAAYEKQQAQERAASAAKDRRAAKDDDSVGTPRSPADYYNGLRPETAKMLRWINDPQQQQARGGPTFDVVRPTASGDAPPRRLTAAQAARLAKQKAADRAAAYRRQHEAAQKTGGSSPRGRPSAQQPSPRSPRGRQV